VRYYVVTRAETSNVIAGFTATTYCGHMVRCPTGDSMPPSASPTKSWRRFGPACVATRRVATPVPPAVVKNSAYLACPIVRPSVVCDHRAAGRARGVAPAVLGVPDVQGAMDLQRAAAIEPAGRLAAWLGSFQARPQEEPVLTVRLGGTRRPISPCLRCRTCECQQTRDYSAAQHALLPSPCRPSHSRRQSRSSSRRSTSRRRHTRSPNRDSSPGPPQLRREEAQPEETSTKDEGTLSWDEAQAQFGLGAGPMSQGSGSLVAFFDAEICDQLIQDLRGVDGKLPEFDSVGSDPGSPPLALEAEVAHGEGATQTTPVPTHDQSTDPQAATVSMSDQATQVLSWPHQATSSTQTPFPASTSDQGIQVLLRAPRLVAYTQTATEAKRRRTSWTRVLRPQLQDTGTDMSVIATKTAECQAGCFLDNDVIPPGAPGPKLPWAYSYAIIFNQLLHPAGAAASWIT